MAKIPIGLQMYTVREQLAEDPVGTLEAVAKIGYAGVEGGTPQGMTTENFLSLLADNGMQVIGGRASASDLQNDIQKVVDNCGALGISSVMMGFGSNLSTDEWKAAVAGLAEGAANAAANGIRVLYHNHAHELEQTVGDETCLDYLLRTIPASDIGAELDVYWVQTGGKDPGEYIRKYAGRTPFLHVKDRAPSPADEECPFAEVGHGILDWDDVFAAAEEQPGVEWYIVEQDRWTRPPIESARMSFDYLASRGMA